MQSFSSRIWTRVAVSISYNNNNYTKFFSLSKATHQGKEKLNLNLLYSIKLALCHILLEVEELGKYIP